MSEKLNGLITEEDFSSYTQEQRDRLIFRYLQKIDARTQSLEKRKRFDTACGIVAGFFGGAGAMIGKWFLIRN